MPDAPTKIPAELNDSNPKLSTSLNTNPIGRSDVGFFMLVGRSGQTLDWCCLFAINLTEKRILQGIYLESKRHQNNNKFWNDLPICGPNRG